MRAACSDQELVRLYIQGDEGAFETIVNRYQEQVFSKILFIVRDQEVANDLFQDTFIKVIHTLKSGKYQEEGKFLPWVLRIAHNLAIDHFRKVRKIPVVRSTDEFDVFAGIADGNRDVETAMMHSEIERDVRMLIERLPEEQREVVLMRIEEDLCFREIAERTGVSINTALGRMRYALINLRKLVEQHRMRLTVQ
jgi:RNA polymerase sigma-70 factor (ECF subfamily)